MRIQNKKFLGVYEEDVSEKTYIYIYIKHEAVMLTNLIKYGDRSLS